MVHQGRHRLRRRDLQLATDRTNPASPMLARKEHLENLWLLHMLLQETRGVVHVPDGHSTLFVLGSQTVGCSVCDFDSMAVPIGWPNPIMVRLGEVTVMGAVDDRGALALLRSETTFQAASQLLLHPIQVRALWAILVHRAHLLRLDRLPLRYGVAEQRLWIDRLPAVDDPTDPSLEVGIGRCRPITAATQVLVGPVGTSSRPGRHRPGWRRIGVIAP